MLWLCYSFIPILTPCLLLIPLIVNVILLITYSLICIFHIAVCMLWQESSDFSDYQMTRLLKRRSVQVSLENAEREMGGKSLSLGEIEEILSEQGVVTNSNIGSRIAADSITRYVYVKGNPLDYMLTVVKITTFT